MFDDHISPSAPQPPKNLPISPPDDMFAGTSDSASPSDDAVYEAPSAVEAGILKPKVQPTMQASSASYPQAMETTPSSMMSTPQPVSYGTSIPPYGSQSQPGTALPTDLYALKEPRTGRFLFISLASLIGLGVFLFVIWFVYQQFIAPPSTEEALSPTLIPTSADTANIDSLSEDIPSEIVPTNEALDEALLFGQPVDADGDGLDDDRELDIGTMNDNWDTDSDQLSDGDEVIIWKTDPLVADTDSDGYDDGAEVKAGYSPTGPGKIFEPPVEDSVVSSSPVIVPSSLEERDADVSSSSVTTSIF